MNLLYTMEDVAVYGYLTPLKVKIILALALSDAVVRDADVLTVRTPPARALPPLLHMPSRRSSGRCTRRTASPSRTRS